MSASKTGVILVGHGGIPKDCPRHLVTQLKRLEGDRRSSGRPPSPEEIDLDRTIRHWPRSTETDPYQAGLQTVASALQRLLDGVLCGIAYNEYCTPTLEEAVGDLIRQGATDITVITTMFTPGGSHSEVEIPEILNDLRPRHPGVELRYAWPFDLNLVAQTLAEQLRCYSRLSSTPTSSLPSSFFTST
jgi:sirohydrochlorin cobaltochelatase